MPPSPNQALFLLSSPDSIVAAGNREWNRRSVAKLLLVAGILVAEATVFAWKTEPPPTQTGAAVRVAASTPGTPANGTGTHPLITGGLQDPAPGTAERFLAAEADWQAGHFAQASRGWRALAEERGDLEVADWAAKAAARSGDLGLMADAGATWRATAGMAGERVVPLGPRPGLTFFAGLLQKDGYLDRTYAPSGEQGAAGPGLLEEAYAQWLGERSAPSHPFAIEDAARERIASRAALTGNDELDAWLSRFPDERSTVIAEFTAKARGRWSPALHDQLWEEAGPANDNAMRAAREDLKASLAREPRPGVEAWRQTRASPNPTNPRTKAGPKA